MKLCMKRVKNMISFVLFIKLYNWTRTCIVFFGVSERICFTVWLLWTLNTFFLSKPQHGTQLCLSISVLTVIFVKECMKINVSRVKFATACQCLLFVQRKFSAGYFARLPFAKNRFCAPIKFWGALFPSYVARFPC